ncbi:DUF5336 domain-containing protein [Streptomyces sp. PT12]|uniref:DUF5336 domain-containing protein n=1 Tax=Streptomyces sp. PT12 TaxID=1510197 RepID=UPI000DE56AA1|nr:DUF5336 domain-containing protein [Streptomyces sp. PT12]RBM18966.1 hypothetical protein DEH69_11080 [Streptomyces sp. PT12]
MNNRSLSRGDGVVIVAAVLLLIASFLDARSADAYGGGEQSWSGWSADWFPILPSVFLAGILGAAAIVGARFLPQPQREFLGLRVDQWGIALSVTSAWAGFWTLVGGPDGVDVGAGIILGFIASLALAGAAAATPVVPALRAPLTGAPKPAGYGQQPPFGGQPGYGYPGAGTPQYGQPGQPGVPGQPQPGQGAAAGVAHQPTQAVPSVGGGADPNFQPFWFAVPAARPLYGEDGSPTPVAELAPGTWYLAVEQRGQSLVAQTQDGRRGVLQDTSGIQRG